MSKKFKNTEAITKAFIKDGWSRKTLFSEVTKEEAEENGHQFILRGIKGNRKFFKMNISGNIYDDTGKVALYNVKTAM